MTILYATCAWIMWGASTGATHYDVYVNGISSQTVTEPKANICKSAPFYTPVSVYVVGLNDTGEQSEPSDALTAQWEANFDADENGVIGMSDFGRFGQSFGDCNDTVKQVPCGSK